MNAARLFRMAIPWVLLAALGCASLPDESPIETQPLELGAEEWRVTDRVVVITDASGTMYARRTFPAAKALTRSFVAAMPEADVAAERTGGYAAGSIGFGGDDRIGSPLAPFDRAALAATAASLEIMGDVSGTGGTTPLDAVIREVGTSLADQPGRAALVIFSDGLADDEAAAIRAAERLVAGRAGEVCIHAVQAGADPAGYVFLERLTGLTPCGSLRSGDQVTTGYEVQQLARAVFLGPAPLPAVAAVGPCAGVARLRGVEFRFDEDTITEAGRSVLDGVVVRLAGCPEIRIIISGHTDSIGADEYNADLSYRRAVATSSYLVESGIEPIRLETEGFGESQPIAPNDTSEGRSRNRRVELAPSL